MHEVAIRKLLELLPPGRARNRYLRAAADLDGRCQDTPKASSQPLLLSKETGESQATVRRVRVSIPPLPDPTFSLWPAALPILGSRHVGPFTPCALCEAGTWARFGGTPLCLHCALTAGPDRLARLVVGTVADVVKFPGIPPALDPEARLSWERGEAGRGDCRG